MPVLDANSLLRTLLAATTSLEYRNILGQLGDKDDLSFDIPFGPHSLVWKTYGDDQSNISTINIATKPGRTIAERITNGIDALLEQRVAPNTASPASAREAAQTWFGRPIPITDAQTARWYRKGQFDRKVHVILLPGDLPTHPTIDVFDSGIGILPDKFPTTILSLHQGNKIDKFYQVGLFGQGGSASLGFCNYILIVSRNHRKPNSIGYTVIRILRLNDNFKEDCFAYLTRQTSEGEALLEANISSELPLYESDEKLRIPDLVHGTLVRHVGFRLEGIDKQLQASPGNMWHYLNAIMFDPLLPFRLVDLRDTRRDRHRNELISGSRTRLVSTTASSDEELSSEETRPQARYYREIEYMSAIDGGPPTIAIEYWVVFAYRKKNNSLELRSSSNELFVQSNHPIVFTLNGQNQGELSGQTLRECGLSLLSRHMVVHVDATEAHKTVRRELFSTTREGLKDGPVRSRILNYLKKMLTEDQNLFDIERQLTEKLAKRDATATREEVRKQVVRLLKEAGLELSEPGPTNVQGAGEVRSIEQDRRTNGPVTPRPPFPTLPYPSVTRFEIVWPKEKLRVRLQDAETVLVETDADAQFDREMRISIRTEPPILEVAGKSLLRGGRLRWRMRPNSLAQSGRPGVAIATLTLPNGAQLTSELPFEVLPALEQPSKKSTGTIPPFEIIPVDPSDTETWGTVWSEDIWPTVSGEAASEQATVAYRTLRVQGKTHVYYSTVFDPYKATVEKLKTEGGGKLDLFTTAYSVWIAYHAILQDRQRPKELEQLEENERERILDQERQTVARMQIRQALREMDLRLKLQTQLVEA
jgi:hypothetical protein